MSTAVIGAALLLTVVGLLTWALVRGVIEEPGVVGSLATAAGAVVAVVYGRARERRLQLQLRIATRRRRSIAT